MNEPHYTVDADAESTVLLEFYHSDWCQDRVYEEVNEMDFQLPANRRAFELLADARRGNIDFHSDDLKQIIADDQMIFDALHDGARHSMQLPEGIRRVKRATLRYQAYSHIRQMELALEDPMATAEEVSKIVDSMRKTIDSGSIDGEVPVSVAVESLDTRMKLIRAGKLEVSTWNIGKLNEITWMEGGQLVVLAARPRVGKTAMMISRANAGIANGEPIGIICQEMDEKQLVQRLLSQRTGIPYKTFSHGLKGCTAPQIALYAEEMMLLKRQPLHLQCGRRFSPGQIRSISKNWLNRYQIKFLFIDYLQNMRHNKGTKLNERIGSSCESVKELAMELNIPVILLSQLGRVAENTMPRIDHLSESGNIECHADTIMLMDRTDITIDAKKRVYWEMVANEHGTKYRKEADLEGRAAIIVAKQRNGESGLCIVDFDKIRMQFR